MKEKYNNIQASKRNHIPKLIWPTSITKIPMTHKNKVKKRIIIKVDHFRERKINKPLRAQILLIKAKIAV